MSYLKLRPDRVAMQDATAQVSTLACELIIYKIGLLVLMVLKLMFDSFSLQMAVLQFISSGLPKVGCSALTPKHPIVIIQIVSF